MNNLESKLVLAITKHGRIKQGIECTNPNGMLYRHDRGFLGKPNDETLKLFKELANGSTQFFSGNYSFHIGYENQISFVKLVKLDTKSAQISSKIQATKGKFFSVSFVKKDGTTRNMTARIGVIKGVNGKGLNYIPSDKNLIVVYAMDKLSYRMINLETVSSFKFNKQLTNY